MQELALSRFTQKELYGVQVAISLLFVLYKFILSLQCKLCIIWMQFIVLNNQKQREREIHRKFPGEMKFELDQLEL